MRRLVEEAKSRANDEGAKIVIAGRRVPEGEALAKQLGAACTFRQTDVTQG